jgi:hypothetical protein
VIRCSCEFAGYIIGAIPGGAMKRVGTIPLIAAGLFSSCAHAQAMNSNEELVRAQGKALWDANLRLLGAADRNMDGVQTISDVGMLIKGIFYLPGDFLLTHLMMVAPSLAIFFEVDAGSLDGGWAGFWSVLAWPVLLVISVLLFGLSGLAMTKLEDVMSYIDQLRIWEIVGLCVLVALPPALGILMVAAGVRNDMLNTPLILVALAETALVLFYWRKLRR